jgi:nucleoid-associated protein YgaU
VPIHLLRCFCGPAFPTAPGPRRNPIKDNAAFSIVLLLSRETLVDRRKKIGLVVLVLGAGVGLALQFRKADSLTSPADPIVQAKPNSESAGWPRPEQPLFANSDTTASAGIVPSTTKADPVSTVPRPNLSALVEVNRAGSLVDLNAPEETHTIVDGDTLAKLAAHYLGSADRSNDLFEHNRDVLRNPDELPIGAVLRIPLLVTLPTPTNGTAPAATQAEPPLVPASQTAPVKLHRLIDADAAKSQRQQRTYTVQPGDSLVDIARKLYGDGRRYENLYEANRQVLPSPTNLKPGTVLVVP